MHDSAEKASAPVTITLPPGFRPSVHGFGFLNRFPGLPVPVHLPILPSGEKLFYGLCGGMCFAALDLLESSRPLPALTDPPARSTRLYRYLVRRQLDSFGRWGRYIPKYVRWMFLPDAEVQRRTLIEYETIRARLAAGEKIVLGLLYNSIRETVAVWENHQVLAYYAQDIDDHTLAIPIYDPNRPRDDSGFILCRRVSVGQKNGAPHYGLVCEQQSRLYKPRWVRGFFPVLAYRPVTPPDFDGQAV